MGKNGLPARRVEPKASMGPCYILRILTLLYLQQEQEVSVSETLLRLRQSQESITCREA